MRPAALTQRDVGVLKSQEYDLIVVGGGVYGIMISLEAARRGLRPLLLERRDFGAATSYNSLRIVHGGLRYLQTADLRRFREHIGERRWFLSSFPDLVRPLPCLMPLFGDGPRRRPVLSAMLAVNDFLSSQRNVAVPADRNIPSSRTLSAEEVRRLCPAVPADGLNGGALWYDGFIPNAPRLFMETLRWACAYGATVLNYMDVVGLIENGGRVAGVRALDLADEAEVEFRADVVINAAGPWSEALAARCGARRHALFAPSIAWNVVLRREPPSEYALGVRPRRRGAQTYFLVPWKGVLLAGTGHAPWSGPVDDPVPGPDLLRSFIAGINEALPGLDIKEKEVDRLLSGLLPAARAGSADLADRETIIDHGKTGGPVGFVSLSGVKLTTARRVAETVLRRVFPSSRPRAAADFRRPKAVDAPPDYPYLWMPRAGEDGWKAALRRTASEEAVQHLDDLLLRRSSLGDNPERALALAPQVCVTLGWDAERSRREIGILRRALGRE